MVHALADGGDAPLDVITYFDALTHNLYDLAECEDSFIDACLAKRADKGTKRIDVGTPLTAEQCDAIANPTGSTPISAEAFVDAIEPFLDEIGVPRDDGTDEHENGDDTPLVEEGAHEGEIRTPSTEVVNLADAVAQAEASWPAPDTSGEAGGITANLSAVVASDLWTRATEAVDGGISGRYRDVEYALTIDDMGTEAALVLLSIDGGSLEAARLDAQKLGVLGGCVFKESNADTGYWEFESLPECAEEPAEVGVDLASGPDHQVIIADGATVVSHLEDGKQVIDNVYRDDSPAEAGAAVTACTGQLKHPLNPDGTCSSWQGGACTY